MSFLIKLQAEACNFVKKETLAQVFSCEFHKIFKNIFSYRTPPLAASERFRKVLSFGYIYKKYENDGQIFHQAKLSFQFQVYIFVLLLHELFNNILMNNPANVYLFKVSNRSTRKRCDICSKLTIITARRLQ